MGALLRIFGFFQGSHFIEYPWTAPSITGLYLRHLYIFPIRLHRYISFIYIRDSLAICYIWIFENNLRIIYFMTERSLIHASSCCSFPYNFSSKFLPVSNDDFYDAVCNCFYCQIRMYKHCHKIKYQQILINTQNTS